MMIKECINSLIFIGKFGKKKTEKNNMKYNVSVPLNGKQEKNK